MLGCIDPRDVTPNALDRRIYEAHNAGGAVSEIAGAAGRDPDDVRMRIARVWRLDRERCLESRRRARL